MVIENKNARFDVEMNPKFSLFFFLLRRNVLRIETRRLFLAIRIYRVQREILLKKKKKRKEKRMYITNSITRACKIDDAQNESVWALGRGYVRRTYYIISLADDWIKFKKFEDRNIYTNTEIIIGQT